MKFGEVESIDLREEYPVGLVLLMRNGGVILEESFDTKGENTDIVHAFEEGLNLRKEEDLVKCLEGARKYEPDLGVTIFVDPGVDPEEEAKKTEKRKTFLSQVVANNLRHPYKVF